MIESNVSTPEVVGDRASPDPRKRGVSTAGRVATLLGLGVGAGLLMVLGSLQAASAEETAPEAAAADTGSTPTRQAPTRSTDTGSTDTGSTGSADTGSTGTSSTPTRQAPTRSTDTGSTVTGRSAPRAVETTVSGSGTHAAGDACATASSAAVVAGSDPCNNPNNPECYETLGFGACDKFDGVNAQTFEVPVLPEGFHYTLAIVKAGSEQSGAGQEFHTCTGLNCNAVQPGQILTHSTGKDISYVILCSAADGSPPPPPLPPPPPPLVQPLVRPLTFGRIGEVVEVTGAGGELPTTGADVGDLAMMGFVLLMGGAGLVAASTVAASRRRRVV